MNTIEQRIARFNAYQAFENRQFFVKQLAKDLGIESNENGWLNIAAHPKADEFYEALEQYDADVKAINIVRLMDKADAEAEANQGHQALTDDE